MVRLLDTLCKSPLFGFSSSSSIVAMLYIIHSLDIGVRHLLLLISLIIILIFQNRYGIVHPNGVICLKPGSKIEFYDRVSMLQDIGYRVEIAGQPITNEQLLLTQPYINEHIEDDVGIRDSSKLQVFRLVEHRVVILFDFDSNIFQYHISNITISLIGNLNLKGYYVRTPTCDDNGNSLVDTGFLVIKPSIEEFNNMRESYLNTPYDPELGWNSEGHNQCDGKLGLPGFLSYYFSVTDGYEELDRCRYRITGGESCISTHIQRDAQTANGLANIIQNKATSSSNRSPATKTVNQATQIHAVPPRLLQGTLLPVILRTAADYGMFRKKV